MGYGIRIGRIVSEVGKRVLFRVEKIQAPAISPNPDTILAVLIYLPDGRVGKGAWIEGIVILMGIGSQTLIVAADPVCIGAYPQDTV